MSLTARHRAASPDLVACRNAPGGGTQATSPNIWCGGRAWAMGMSPHVSRARSAAPAMRASSSERARSGSFPPDTTTSSPAGPWVTASDRVSLRPAPAATRSESTGRAFTICGTSTRQWGTGTIRSDARSWNPISTPSRLRRADSTARRREAGGEVAMPVIGAARPCAVSACATTRTLNRATKVSEACISAQAPQRS